MHSIRALKTLLGVQCALTAILPPVLGSPVIDHHVTKRKFELTLTLQKQAPDGFKREMILVNGQFPGPLIEIDQGDEVEILVHNTMQYNTTIHYHGMASVSAPMTLSDTNRY
jgi:FtsP/CotA-like multicopper oxidase with cupredoxin domain